NEVRDAEDGSTHFSINIIPHTAKHTTLGQLASGQQLNVEVDVLAGYIDRMLAARAQYEHPCSFFLSHSNVIYARPSLDPNRAARSHPHDRRRTTHRTAPPPGRYPTA